MALHLAEEELHSQHNWPSLANRRRYTQRSTLSHLGSVIPMVFRGRTCRTMSMTDVAETRWICSLEPGMMCKNQELESRGRHCHFLLPRLPVVRDGHHLARVHHLQCNLIDQASHKHCKRRWSISHRDSFEYEGGHVRTDSTACNLDAASRSLRPNYLHHKLQPSVKCLVYSSSCWLLSMPPSIPKGIQYKLSTIQITEIS